MTKAKLTRPSLIATTHNLSGFDCGEPELDDWLKKHAQAARFNRTATVLVVCRGHKVVGYYALCNGAVAHTATSAKVRKNMPNPIPAIILARLAVDKTEQGAGLGASLLRDAFRRTLVAAKLSAANLVIVQPLHSKAAVYYAKHGFRPLRTIDPLGDPPQPMYLSLSTIADGL